MNRPTDILIFNKVITEEWIIPEVPNFIESRTGEKRCITEFNRQQMITIADCIKEKLLKKYDENKKINQQQKLIGNYVNENV